MLDAADWERANKEFKIPQPSIIGRILCCPTPPSKLKDGAYFEEPEKVTTDWLKPFVRTALDVNIDGEDDNVTIQGLDAAGPHTINEIAAAILSELHGKGIHWKHQVQELCTFDDGCMHLIHSKLESHHGVCDAMATHYQQKMAEAARGNGKTCVDGDCVRWEITRFVLSLAGTVKGMETMAVNYGVVSALLMTITFNNFGMISPEDWRQFVMLIASRYEECLEVLVGATCVVNCDTPNDAPFCESEGLDTVLDKFAGYSSVYLETNKTACQLQGTFCGQDYWPGGDALENYCMLALSAYEADWWGGAGPRSGAQQPFPASYGNGCCAPFVQCALNIRFRNEYKHAAFNGLATMGLFVVMLLATFLYMSIQACNIDNTKLKERMIFKELRCLYITMHAIFVISLILTVCGLSQIMSIKVTTLALSWLVFLLIFMGAAIAAVLLVRTMYTLNHMNVLVAGVRKKREKTVRATFSAPSANAKLIRSEV